MDHVIKIVYWIVTKLASNCEKKNYEQVSEFKKKEVKQKKKIKKETYKSKITS